MFLVKHIAGETTGSVLQGQIRNNWNLTLISPSTVAADLNRLLAGHDAVIWLQASPDELAPPCAPACTVLGSRWEVKGRHRSGEIHWGKVWYPQRWLFRREWLLTNAGSAQSDAPR